MHDLINSSCETATQAQIGGLSKATGIVEMLRHRQANLKAQLSEVDEAIAALDKNPEMARVLELATRAVRY